MPDQDKDTTANADDSSAPASANEALASAREEAEAARSRITELEAELAAATERHQTAMAEAVSTYRSALITANPIVPPDLLAGTTITEINESFIKAKAIVDQITASVLAKTHAGLNDKPADMPSGGIGRTTPDYSALNPLEKIRVGLSATNGR